MSELEKLEAELNNKVALLAQLTSDCEMLQAEIESLFAAIEVING